MKDKKRVTDSKKEDDIRFFFLFIIFMIAYSGMLLVARVFIMIANGFFPDPIPYVDEILMFALLFKRL
jgi:hypothetical protein